MIAATQRFGTRGWLLFAAMAVLWGMPYLFIKQAVDSYSPASVVAGRTLLGALLLLPFALRQKALRPAFAQDRLGARVRRDRDGRAVPAARARRADAAVGPHRPARRDRPAVRRAHRVHRRRPGRAEAGAHDRAHRRIRRRRDHRRGARARGRRRRRPHRRRRGAAGRDLLRDRAVHRRPAAQGRARRSARSRSRSPRSGCSTCRSRSSPSTKCPRRRAPCRSSRSAVLCTAVAFIVFFALIAHVGPARAPLFTYVNPVVAIMLGVIVLGEEITLGLLIGFPLVILGCWLAATGGTVRTARDDGRPAAGRARLSRVSGALRRERPTTRRSPRRSRGCIRPPRRSGPPGCPTMTATALTRYARIGAKPKADLTNFARPAGLRSA